MPKKMRKLFFILLIVISSAAHIKSQDTYFPYPTPPEDMTVLQERTNYMIYHFWDRCNWKSAFSSVEKFKGAFDDYLSFMFIPGASVDTINLSIDNLIKNIQKTPKNLLKLGELAENALYGDSAAYWSDELYLPFAKAIATNKKISNAEKARYKLHTQILSHCQEGMIVPSFTFETREGNEVAIDTITAPTIILVFSDPDCDDCALARVRLSANIKANQLINSGYLKVISIYPGEADEDWRQKVSNYPDNWLVGAYPNADLYYDLRLSPAIYMLNSQRRIIKKNLRIEHLINAFSVLR